MSTGLSPRVGAAVPGGPTRIRRADPRRRYAGHGPGTFGVGVGSPLPRTVDDAEKAWGLGLYDLMSLMPAVRACETIVAAGVIGDGLKLAPAASADIDDPDAEDDPDVVLAAQIRDECLWVAERLDTPIDDLAADFVALGRRYGTRLGEIVWEDATGPDGRRRLVPKDVAVLPRKSFAFVVDAYGDVAKVRVSTPADANGVGYEDVDPDKFMWFTPAPRDRDPRGESAYRAAYDAWLSASKTKPQRFKYNHRFGQPIVTVIGPENPLDVEDDDGETVTWDEDMADRLASLAGGSYLILPNGATVAIHEASGNGEAFERTFDRDNREIALALLTNSRTILEAEHSSKADATAAKDVTDTVVGLYRRKSATFWRDTFFYRYVLNNYGKDIADRLTPDVSFGSGAKEDAAALLTAFAQWAKSYPATEAQLRAADERLGLPVREFGAEVYSKPAPPALPAPAEPPATDVDGPAESGEDGGAAE